VVLQYFHTPTPARLLRREMNDLFSGLLGDLAVPAWFDAGRGRPAVNIWETPETVHAELELPGVAAENVDVSVVGDELTIKIERPELEQEGVTYHRRERGVGSFTRVLRLPCEVDADKVEAELRRGVLTISLTKAETARPRKIPVSVPN